MPASIEQIDFNGIPALQMLSADGASAVISLVGAQVLSWRPAGRGEQLYLSEYASFDGQSPIRGGIPVCFPQFSQLGKLPKHGFARTALWQVRERRDADGYAMVTLSLNEDEHTHGLWPWMFDAEITVLVDAKRLDIEFAVENTGHSQFAFTGALHTYLRVSEVENATLEGLNGYQYRDAADENRIKRDRADVLQVDDEVNRVYHNVSKPLLLRDGQRNLVIEMDGFPDVVVWNPWEAHCASMSDMQNSDFRRMLCVEAAAAQSKVLLEPEDVWVGRQTLINL